MSRETLHVLNIEDNPADADLLMETLALPDVPARHAQNIHIHWAPRLEQGLAQMAVESFDAVLLDLNLPDSRGLDTLLKVRNLAPNTAILVMTGNDDEELALRAVQAGAQDYLVKGQVNSALLERAIRYAIERKRIESALNRRASELEALYQTFLEINTGFELSTVLNSIVERVAHLINAPMVGLFLLDPEDESLILTVAHDEMARYIGAVIQPGEGVTGRVAQTGQLMNVPDYERWPYHAAVFASAPFKRVLAIPMKVQSRVIGVIHISDDRHTGLFDADEVRLASMLADQAALVVEKARLLEAEKQRSMELARSNRVIAALNGVSSRLQATMDTEKVMETVGAELQNLGVFLEITRLDPESGNLVIQYVSLDQHALAEAEALVGRPIPSLHRGDTLQHSPRLLEDRKPRFNNQVWQMFASALGDIPRQVIHTALAKLRITPETCAIFLPMMVKDRPMGALLIWGNDLVENDVPAFTVFASQVTAALENARLYNEIQKLAIMDELTGLYNRRGFFTLAQQQIRVAERLNSGLLLIFADIDGMKEINDTLGHQMGDQALKDAAHILRQTYRTADVIARMGGDEFAVLAMMSEKPETGPLARRLAEQVEEFNATHPRPYHLSLSMGMAAWPAGKLANLDELLSRADARMYTEKRTKKEHG